MKHTFSNEEGIDRNLFYKNISLIFLLLDLTSMSFWTWVLPIYDRMNVKIVKLLKIGWISRYSYNIYFLKLLIDKNKYTKNGQTEVVKYLHSFFEVRIFKNYKKKLQT